ncbi:MAG: TetR/AcrR family transcriptional regulator [Clostridia bacterium]|nr:TetR/AcrR family transcriptional regulator [Clostridia bacterium]
MRRKNTTTEMMKSYIVESLLILMEEKPFADITISDIVNRAGVNRSTYYRHFYAKEDIVTYFFDNLMHEYMNIFKQNSNPTFYQYLLTIFSTFFNYKEDLLIIHKADLSHLYIVVLNKWFQFHPSSATISNAKQFEIAYHIGGIYNNTLLWLEHEMQETPEEMANMALSLRPVGALTLLNI